jgi:hypothetical protein
MADRKDRDLQQPAVPPSLSESYGGQAARGELWRGTLQKRTEFQQSGGACARPPWRGGLDWALRCRGAVDLVDGVDARDQKDQRDERLRLAQGQRVVWGAGWKHHHQAGLASGRLRPLEAAWIRLGPLGAGYFSSVFLGACARPRPSVARGESRMRDGRFAGENGVSAKRGPGARASWPEKGQPILRIYSATYGYFTCVFFWSITRTGSRCAKPGAARDTATIGGGLQAAIISAYLAQSGLISECLAFFGNIFCTSTPRAPWGKI